MVLLSAQSTPRLVWGWRLITQSSASEGPSLCTTLLGAPYRVERQAFWRLAEEVTSDLAAWLTEGDGPLFFSALTHRPVLLDETSRSINQLP